MADDKELSWKLDLDTADFVKKGLEAKGIVSEIGSAENMTGLLEGLVHTSAALGVAGLAAYAFKEALDLTMEGEEIKRIEGQFERLAKQAGISSRELKEGMEAAAGGLVDTTDLLKTANQAIVEMGGSAEKLPELMELARKSTAVFGGELSTNFENITNAIARGNTRMLKHYGIIVDSTAAVQKFADAHGIAQNELSEAAKKQAILAEALEQGNKAFAGVTGAMAPTKTAMQEMKVAWQDFKEAVAVTVSTLTGTYFKDFFHSIGEMAKSAKTHLLSAFGKGEAADTAKLDVVREKLLQAKAAAIDLEQRQLKGMFTPRYEAQMAEVQANIKKYQEQLGITQKKVEQNAQEQEKIDKTVADSKTAITEKEKKDDLINKAEHLKNEQKFQTELLKLQEATTKEQEKDIRSLDIIDGIMMEQGLNRYRAHANAITKIRADTTLVAGQKKALEAQEYARYNSQELASEKELAKTRMALLDSYVANSKTNYQGIQRAAQQMTLQAKKDLTDFGAKGKATMASFKSNATAAFSAIGQGIAQNQDVAKAAADAMKGFFLNMIGDRAEAEGGAMLLSGIWPPNPVAIAGGGALIALGGALKSLAGSSGGGASVPSVGGGGGAAAPALETQQSAADQSQQLQSQQQVQQRSVHINIAGNLMDTQESQRTLMEVMRKETDATDFTYNKVGI